MASKFVHEVQLTQDLVLFSTKLRTSPRDLLNGPPSRRLVKSKTQKFNREEHRLCILFGWYGAKKRHLMKFVQFYLDQDFDVLLHTITGVTTHLCNPMGFPKAMAQNILEFCRTNQRYGPIVVHGFSVGAVVWGAMVYFANQNPQEYHFLHKKIVGQVWDSPFINIERLPQAGSFVAFPKSRTLQKLAEIYLKFYMKLHRFVSDYFRKAAKGFHDFNTRTHFLLFTSEDDMTVPRSEVAECAKKWENRGSSVCLKIWERSRHVCHIRDHPEEYTTLLRDFLRRTSLLKYPDRFQILVNSKDM